MGGESALPGGIGLDFIVDTGETSRFATISPALAISQYRVSFISFNGEAVSEVDQIFSGTSRSSSSGPRNLGDSGQC